MNFYQNISTKFSVYLLLVETKTITKDIVKQVILPTFITAVFPKRSINTANVNSQTAEMRKIIEQQNVFMLQSDWLKFEIELNSLMSDFVGTNVTTAVFTYT